jgi:hypothetical protein
VQYIDVMDEVRPYWSTTSGARTAPVGKSEISIILFGGPESRYCGDFADFASFNDLTGTLHSRMKTAVVTNKKLTRLLLSKLENLLSGL